MKKITSFGIFMLLSLFIFTAKAEKSFDLTTAPGGILVMDYDAVSTEKAKLLDERWISVTNFGANGTSGKCGSASKTFDIKLGRLIEFYLEKCDQLTITANIASGRGLTINIDGGANIQLAGTGACKDYVVDVNKEVPVKIKVQGLNSSSAWTSYFTFSYAAKVPSISSFKINGTNAAINHDTKEISLQLPFGTDISAITPEVILGGIATSFSPAGVQNFSTGPIIYTATDGITQVNYTANITAKTTPDTEKSISSMTINGKTATIDESTGAISCEFPSFTGALGNWPVVFTLNSTTGSVNYTSETSYDFLANNSLIITVTAQDNSTKVYTVTPTISTKKNIGILSINGKAESYDNLLVSAFSDYYVNFLMAEAVAPADIAAFYANYDLIVLHANVGGTNATGLASKAMVGVKPMLNLKAFFYSSGRWSWSSAAPGSSVAGIGSAEVQTALQSHPIFNNVNFTGTTLNYYDNLPAANVNAIQFANDLATMTGFTSQTIATANTSGIQIHEIQDNVAAKYILLGLSIENNNFTFFNSNAINTIKNAADYLLNTSAKFSFSTTNLNTLNEKNSIRYNNNLIYNPDQKSIILFNASGIKIKSSKDATIDTQFFPKGVYLVQTDDMKVFKFIK